MFKLNFNIPEPQKKISLNDSILLIGSCFSNEIGRLLTANKFTSLSNPFGTIYNPHSIFKLLGEQVTSNRLVKNQEIFYHWDAHSTISGLSEEETLALFEKHKIETNNFLRNAKWLILTLGTSIVYENDANEIVANCHKIPSKNFKRRFLTQNEIIADFDHLHSYLKSINPNLEIIFTVSPVRHIKDGLIDNNRSKAILIDAIHSITQQFDHTEYFPSYEIVMDELRDYRFFKADMVHPSDVAINYIWNRFAEKYFDSTTQKILSQWIKLKTGIDHVPFHPSSQVHQKFLRTTLEKLEQMNDLINVSVEIADLKKQLI